MHLIKLALQASIATRIHIGVSFESTIPVVVDSRNPQPLKQSERRHTAQKPPEANFVPSTTPTNTYKNSLSHTRAH